MFRWTIIAVVLVAASGCSALRTVNSISRNSADPTVDLLESELRWMEDNLYRIDDQLERCLTKLESSQRDNAMLRLELAEAQRGQAGHGTSNKSTSPPYVQSTPARSSNAPSYLPSGIAPPQWQQSPPAGPALSAPRRDAHSPARQPTGVPNEIPYNLEPPSIVLGNEAESSATTPTETDLRNTIPDFDVDDVELIELPDPESILKQRRNPADAEDTRGQDAPDLSDPFDSDEARVPVRDQSVARIVLNRKLTGGYNFDKKLGSDGVMVVIEPQNSFAQYLAEPGEITIEVHDPQLAGVAGRVGKWHFDRAESASYVKKTLLGQGIHLELPWPGAAPTNDKLRLSVKYVTRRGQVLHSEQMIRVQPSVQALAAKAQRAGQVGWSPDRKPLR